MTAKRFRVQEHCLRSSYGIEAENWLVTNDNHSVVLNNKAEAHMVANMSNDIIDKFNHLHEENKELKEENEYLYEKIKENEWHWNTIDEDRDVWKYKCKRLEEENEELKQKIDVLEDDNETYHKSLKKLNLYTKRFIPTKCTNEFKDCKTNRYYWLDHEGNFEGCLELLNLLDCEKEVLKSENSHLKAKLMEYEEQKENDSTISRNDFNNTENDDGDVE